MSVASTETPGALAELVRRLRALAKTINNLADSQNFGQPFASRMCAAEDVLAAAFVIDQQKLLLSNIGANMLVGDITADEAMALARMARRLLYHDAERFSNRHDGGAERDAMLCGIGRLGSAPADAGVAPR